MMTTGEDVLRRRHAAGLSQQELARLVQVSPFTIWRYENGKSPLSPRMAARIDAALTGLAVGREATRQEIERRLAAVG